MPEQLDDAATGVDARPEVGPEVDLAVELAVPPAPEVLGDFDAFVAARGQALLRLALMLTGDPHRAEDLVQSTLAKTYLHWRRVRRADAPEAYVRKVLVRQYVSWLRLRSSGEVVGLPAGGAEAEPTGRGTDGAADLATTLASREAAWALLARLPRRQRAVLVLRYYADMSDEQVARALGCSVGTVRSNASRGLATLRTVVPDLDEELLP